ncbi:hypothetical protein V8E52_005947 [Russula decolorans]
MKGLRIVPKKRDNGSAVNRKNSRSFSGYHLSSRYGILRGRGRRIQDTSDQHFTDSGFSIKSPSIAYNLDISRSFRPGMCNQRAGRRPLGAEADEDHHPESKFALNGGRTGAQDISKFDHEPSETTCCTDCHRAPSIARAQLLRDHPGGPSKKRGHLNQPRYSIWNHSSMMLDAKTSCSHTHEKPVWNHALRVSGDCCDTDAGISKMWRFVRLKDTVTEMRSQFALHIRSKLPRALLQDNTFHRKRQRMGLTALRRDKYTELAAVVEENNP